VALVEYQDIATPEVIEPATPQTLALEEVIARAEGMNPAIAEAEARIRALRGEWLQAGLAPNPSVGYLGSEVGNDGSAGQQGAFAGQEFVTGGKLARQRAVVAAEIELAQQNLAATRMRVTTDVRIAYYRVLAAQRRVALADELVTIGDSLSSTSRDLLSIGEIPRSTLLQSEVELQNAELTLRTARNAKVARWRQLGVLLGEPNLTAVPLEDMLDTVPPTTEWQTLLARMAAESPEIQASLAEVERARRVLARECVEPVPNIETQASVQYDYSSYDTIAGVQVGMALPLWNRNQGGIRRARAELTEANRQVDRVTLNLAARLGEAFQEYADAESRTSSYRDEILPRARQTLDLVQKGYPSEVGYLELMTAQRVYSEANLAYIEALGDLWESWARIDGLLLEGSLANGAENPFNGK
jgi:cobalt-zinc-cadmium efflux system outer membrane protein